ncbi:uncharacterized protein LOC126811986 [Patella vulgata]|uniref:uncharacterized protein LOC126811986 n=1 Tax=Patella vulgata TaxID=6465 RepID=UPI0024A9E534|nr:uncharacterized protein LOC126811986 [Patella vulgata]
MFSLLRKKSNLSQSSQVSTSCPSISSPGTTEDSSNVSQDSTGSSETDEEDIPKASRSQRLFARKSIRRQRKREKDFEKKIKHNKITMEDYLSKQTEFKLWLTEEKHKTITDIKSPKAKSYFKSFVKLWNKRKLAQKYYRGTLSCETPPNQQGLSKQRFNFVSSLDESPFPNSVSFPQTIDLSHEGSILSDSPFSTFGKTPGSPTPVIKTPGSGHDLLDLKRKAIFNNMGRESVDQPKFSDQSIHTYSSASDSNGRKKSGSSGSASLSSESSGSVSDSPRSSKSSKSRKDKEENLYKVTLLSWTSKGELKVHPAKSPNLPDIAESPGVDPDILAKHITSTEYSAIDEHNMSIPYKEVEDAVMDTNDPTYCEVELHDPTYASPYNSNKFMTKLKTDNNDDVFNSSNTKSSCEDLYAVPIKKKKSSDQSETVSLTSNESATQLDRKVSTKSGNHVEMDKLSDIVSSGSDFSLTSGSSSESLNHHLIVPGQEGLNKASSAPELSTIIEGDVTKAADFTNITALNMTTLNNSYLDTANKSGNRSYVDMDQWKKGIKARSARVDETLMNTTEDIEDVRIEPAGSEFQHRLSKMADYRLASSSTPDPLTRQRKRNPTEPCRRVISKQPDITQSSNIQTPKRTLSDPSQVSEQKEESFGKKTGSILRSSLPTPPPPPPRNPKYCKFSSNGQKNSVGTIPIIQVEPPTTPEVKSPGSESWPTPPPCLDDVLEGQEQDEGKRTGDIWPTPPTPYDFVRDYKTTSGTPDPCLLWPTPQPPDPKSLEHAATPDSVFESSKMWPTPPSPWENMSESQTVSTPLVEKTNSDDEAPQLVTADFISSKTEPVINKVLPVEESRIEPQVKSMLDEESQIRPPVMNLITKQTTQILGDQSNILSFDDGENVGEKNNIVSIDDGEKVKKEDEVKDNKMSNENIMVEDKEITRVLGDKSNILSIDDGENLKQEDKKISNENSKAEDFSEDKENEGDVRKNGINRKNLVERQMSTASIERFETDIDSVIDSPQAMETETKKRLVLETVV